MGLGVPTVEVLAKGVVSLSLERRAAIVVEQFLAVLEGDTARSDAGAYADRP
jgi:hypothetical protein